MNKTFLNLAVIAGLGLSMPAFSHEDGKANAAIVGDGSGHCVTDGSGVNVRTSSWSEETAASACGAAPVAAAEEAAPAPAPAPTPVSETVTLSAAALFDHDRDVIKDDAKPQLNDFATRVKSLSQVDAVNVVGHTDSSGTDAYNQNLSERRANSVKNYLTGQGVDAAIINTSGMGESQPVADNATKAGRAENRRVEITLKGAQ
ncbi:MAG: OmpA family protein [Gammaproteobacteria bacterium]|nr:OmpA family protein [Gammaproteobacteria bacterium]